MKRIASYSIFLLICMALVSGCDNLLNGKTDKKPLTTTRDTGIHKTVERGPVTVHLDTDKKEMTIADQLHLTLTVIYDEAYKVILPRVGDKLEQFGIVDYHTSQPELTKENRSKISRSYVLEPFLSGDYKIPPMKVQFKKKNDPEDTLHEIETEEITVHVNSLLPENFKDMTMHDIKPPEPLPYSYAAWFCGGGVALFLLASGFAAFFIVRSKKRKAQDVFIRKIPAHEQAFAELQSLVDENLVEKGHIKEFYQKISNILRRYIENRFHLNAPEQTTEEFLSGIHAKNDFNHEYKILLKKFLTHCDLVKFANHQPEPADVQKTFDSCKEFILGTQEKD